MQNFLTLYKHLLGVFLRQINFYLFKRNDYTFFPENKMLMCVQCWPTLPTPNLTRYTQGILLQIQMFSLLIFVFFWEQGFFFQFNKWLIKIKYYVKKTINSVYNVCIAIIFLESLAGLRNIWEISQGLTRCVSILCLPSDSTYMYNTT